MKLIMRGSVINGRFIPEKITQSTRRSRLRPQAHRIYVSDTSTTIVGLLVTLFIVCSAYISLRVIVLSFELCVIRMFPKNRTRRTTKYFLIMPRRPVQVRNEIYRALISTPNSVLISSRDFSRNCVVFEFFD